jgi:hypothetical protein
MRAVVKDERAYERVSPLGFAAGFSGERIAVTDLLP